MCGLNFVQSSFEVKKINLINELKKCEELIAKNKLEDALSAIRKLKRNQIYIEIILKKNYLLLNRLKSIIINLNKKKNHKNFDLIEDISWCIKKEILEDSDRIFFSLKKNKIKNEVKSIVFFKYLNNSIESLNYLETRGRDSASLSINFLSKTKINFLNSKKINNNELIFFQKKISKDKFLSNLTIKYAKQIGYSGENLLKINNILIKSKIFSKINFDDVISFFIIGHTRWASIGEVNLSNCHPFINKHQNNYSLFYMNGDILNHNKLVLETNKNKKFKLSDYKCTNDLFGLPYKLEKNRSLNFNSLQGSYVLIYHQFRNPFKITILKKGSQGLYISTNNDENFLFSSDLYGIVNNSNNFKRTKTNQKISLNPFEFKLKNYNFKNIQKTSISTRDLNKKKFSRFFLKEISDTEVFVKRTINNYLDLKNNKIINMDNLLSAQVEKLLKQKKIKNIIFTGMGSCYTAAVGISKYLSEKLKKLKIFDIKIQATVASEGSAFYLSKNMKDSIIVVLAQSGTTIDTNVFAKMAKERGAYTISIVNKRDGDITYIVENNLYLGNGRDVELSVPSTKTYTAHLFLGFIFSDKIISYIKKKSQSEIFKTSKKIIKKRFINNILNKQFNAVNKINFDILNYIKWVVVYDDSSNSYNCLEFRIKLSECCYKSILYLHIDEFKNYNLNNSLVFYIGEKNIYDQKLFKKNFLISITTKKTKKKPRKIEINLKNELKSLLAIESSIALQLVAFKLSTLIDSNKDKVKQNLNNKKLLSFTIDKKDINNFKKLSKSKKINYLFEKLIRPIDAIKHQAKTVTVGAIRENKNVYIKNNYPTKILNKINIDNFKQNFLNVKKNINLISNSNYDIEKYFFGNLIEYYNSTNKKTLFYNFLNHSEVGNFDQKNYTNIFFGLENTRNSQNDLLIERENLDSYKIIKTFLLNNKKNIYEDKIFINAKNIMENNKKKLNFSFDKYFKNFNNIKFLGSGINYLAAKKFALKLSKELNITIGYDVIENHKHIDISSESLVVLFSSNIYRSGFQKDVLAETKKFTAHNNHPIIFTNLNNNYFDEFENDKKNIKIIKLPKVHEIYSLSIFEFYFNNFVF